MDSEQDCVWTLIYQSFEKVPGKDNVEGKLFGAKNFQKAKSPGKRIFEPRRGK